MSTLKQSVAQLLAGPRSRLADLPSIPEPAPVPSIPSARLARLARWIAGDDSALTEATAEQVADLFGDCP